MRLAAALLVALLPALPAAALGPHEVLLLVNRNSERSLEVANHYARLRNLPAVNIVLLDVPDYALGETGSIRPDDLRASILNPTLAEVRKRGIADHILVWAYAPDFPTQVASEPPVSLTGATFVRGDLPDAELIRKGEFRSPLFAGPDRPDGPFAESRSLEYFAATLSTRMPLPSMLLGVAGTRGMPTHQIIEHLRAARATDATQPKNPVWFATNSDVRVTARSWQFAAAVAELASLGVPATVASDPPRASAGLGGVMMGEAQADPTRAGRLAPGALADHLTSFAALFTAPDQTKVTAWLAHGAAASAGAVTEPYAIWTKFPNARLFAHYARGCTAIESYQLSLRSPLQTLLVGDPLCAPSATPIPVALALLSETPVAVVSGRVELAAAPLLPAQAQQLEYLYLLDGRSLPLAPGPALKIDTALWPDGWHELRVVAYREGPVRHQSQASRGLLFRNRGRSVRLRAVGDAQQLDLHHESVFEVQPEGEVAELALVAQERVLARSVTNRGGVLKLDTRLLGAGPNRLQAVAVYSDRQAVRSEPLSVNVVRSNQAPTVKAFTWTPGADGRGLLGIEPDEPERDRVYASWLEAVDGTAAGRDRIQLPATSAATASWSDEGLAILNPSPRPTPCIASGLTATGLTRISVRAWLPDAPALERRPAAGLAFNVRTENDYEFFGWFWDVSSWAFGRVESGAVRRVVSRGAPCRTNAWAELSVTRIPAGGLQAEVDGQPLCRWPEGTWQDAPVGVFAGEGRTLFQKLCVAPPQRAETRETTAGLELAADTPLEGIWIRLSDGRAAAEFPARRPVR